MTGAGFKSLVDKNLELLNVNAFENDGDSEKYKVITRGLQDYTARGFLLTGTTTETTSGRQVNSRCYYPREVWIGDIYLVRRPMEEILRFKETGTPTAYAVGANSITVSPIPTEDHTYTLSGYLLHSPVTSDSIIEIPDRFIDDAAFYVAAKFFSLPHLNISESNALLTRLSLIEKELEATKAEATRFIRAERGTVRYSHRRLC